MGVSASCAVWTPACNASLRPLEASADQFRVLAGSTREEVVPQNVDGVSVHYALLAAPTRLGDEGVFIKSVNQAIAPEKAVRTLCTERAIYDFTNTLQTRGHTAHVVVGGGGKGCTDFKQDFDFASIGSLAVSKPLALLESTLVTEGGGRKGDQSTLSYDAWLRNEEAGAQSLTPRQKAEVIWQLAYTVRVFHQTGLGHFDLHPGNVLVTRLPGPIVLKYALDEGSLCLCTDVFVRVFDFDMASKRATIADPRVIRNASTQKQFAEAGRSSAWSDNDSLPGHGDNMLSHDWVKLIVHFGALRAGFEADTENLSEGSKRVLHWVQACMRDRKYEDLQFIRGKAPEWFPAEEPFGRDVLRVAASIVGPHAHKVTTEGESWVLPSVAHQAPTLFAKMIVESVNMNGRRSTKRARSMFLPLNMNQ